MSKKTYQLLLGLGLLSLWISACQPLPEPTLLEAHATEVAAEIYAELTAEADSAGMADSADSADSADMTNATTPEASPSHSARQPSTQPLLWVGAAEPTSGPSGRAEVLVAVLVQQDLQRMHVQLPQVGLLPIVRGVPTSVH